MTAKIHDGKLVSPDFQSDGHPLTLPCGKCIGCRNDLTKDWAVRCAHEAQMHTYNCVLTLTFDENNINAQKTLVKSDIQDFIKSLRHFINRNKDLRKNYPYLSQKKISYLYCGEYGSKFERPHYHIIIFGFDFPDKVKLKESDSGDTLFTSKYLEKIWTHGHSTIGAMSMASAMYCASYVTKFVPLNEREEIYCGRLPEFGHASKKPALGLTWFQKYHNDLLAHDAAIIQGQKYRIPRYYKKKLQEFYPEKFTELKVRIEEKLDEQIINYDDLDNKLKIKLEQLKLSGKFKSNYNHKILERRTLEKDISNGTSTTTTST